MANDYSAGYYPYGSSDSGSAPFSYNQNPFGFGLYNPYSMWGQTQNQAGATDQSSLYFPTGTEATQWAAGIPGFQQQANILGSMSSPEGFQSAMQPYINQMLTQLGRSGLPSSSYADRMIGETLGNVYSQQALNTAGGWGSYMDSMAPWASGYGQWPMAIAQLLQG